MRDEFKNDLKGGEGLGSPVDGNESKKPMFNLIPFAGSRRIMCKSQNSAGNFCIIKREDQRGTAPLTGERAQRDLARTSPWSFGHIGIRQGPCARTASRSLGYIGIREKSSARPTSSLRLHPRGRSNLVS